MLLPALAVLGGWLMVLPGSIVTVALRLEQLDPESATRYSLTLASGWLVLLIGLVGFGLIGDRLQRAQGSRARIATLAMPVAVVAAMLLAVAGSPAVLSLAWVLLQVPASAIIATAMAIAAERVPPGRRGLASGLVGVAPLVSILLGSVVIGLLGTAVAFGSALLVIAGIAVTLPAMLDRRESRRQEPMAVTMTGATARVVLPAAWTLLLVADLLLSWATSTGNSYLVAVIETLGTTDFGEVQAAATTLVAFATVIAIAAAIVGGIASRSGRASAVVFGVGTLGVATGLLVMIIAPTPAGLLVAALVFGGGFGAANGAELALAVQLRGAGDGIGADLGTLTAMTSIPYVLAPTAAALILAGDLASGLRVLFGIAAVLAVIGAVLALRIRAFLPSTSATAVG